MTNNNFNHFAKILAKNLSIPAMFEFTLGKEELLNEIISDILNELKTDKVCPLCSEKLYCSDVEAFNYVCPYCDERFLTSEVKEYKYYELEFLTECFNGETKHTDSMCVLGYRKPTIEEAKEFWKTDCEMYGNLIAIYELSKEEAHSSFDMEDEDSWPIFGKEN